MAQENNLTLEKLTWCIEEFAFFDRFVKVDYADLLRNKNNFMGLSYLKERGVWFKLLHIFWTKDETANTAVLFGVQIWIKKKDLRTFDEVVEKVNFQAEVIYPRWIEKRKQLFSEYVEIRYIKDVEV